MVVGLLLGSKQSHSLAEPPGRLMWQAQVRPHPTGLWGGSG
jgi:hypothetical protein